MEAVLLRVLLVGGGPLSPEFLKAVLQEGFDAVYAVDGGARRLKDLAVVPQLLLGDFDSLDLGEVEEWKQAGTAIRSFPEEKDWTDMELALDTAVKNGAASVTILGGHSAGRLDHTLANIGLLYRAEQQGVQAMLRGEGLEVRLIGPGQEVTLDPEDGRDFSLLPLGYEVHSVRVWGVKYPLENGSLHLGDTLGIHNQISARSAHIVGGDGFLILIRFKNE